MKVIKQYKQIASQIANLFYPLVEVRVCEWPNGNEVYVKNKLCDDLPLNTLLNPEKPIPHAPYEITLSRGRRVRVIVSPIFDSQNNIIAVMIIIFEITLLSLLHADLSKLLMGKKHLTEEPQITRWQDQVDKIIEKYLLENNKQIATLSRSNKRSLIYQLHQQGVFSYQEASKYIASRLELSRATIYNYLNQENTLRSVSIHQVDTFTEKPFSGNPAGVVLDAEHLDSETMKKIAREMNLSETAFVLPSPKADVCLRYFTPTGDEVKFCGHSSVGALYMLAHQGYLNLSTPGKHQLTVETGAGVIETNIVINKNEQIAVDFKAPKIILQHTKIKMQELSQQLEISTDSLEQQYPLMYEKTNQDLFIVVKSLDALKQLQINQRAARKFARKNNLICYCFLTKEVFDKKKHQIHMRCYAPAIGIPEDPFTGSVLGGLTAYLVENKIIKKSQKQFGVEQGHFINRPGSVQVKWSQTKRGYQVWVMAKAIHFFSTKVNL